MKKTLFFRTTFQRYPRQFWLIFFGRLLATTGVSMIWPFLLLYISKRLHLPGTQTATLMTINAATGIASSFIVGPLADKIGRKWIMVLGLFTSAGIYFGMIRAETYEAFAQLMALSGIANPLYQIGADAMLADLIPREDRVEAYALVRWSNNLGVAIGPTIGGFLAVHSYALTFEFAASAMTLYGLALLFFARETLETSEETQTKSSPLAGYREVFRDTSYLFIISFIAIGWISAVLMWVILPVYASQEFNVPENLYGFIPTTNALMVVLFQVYITRFTKRYPPMKMMALGMVFYAVGTGMVAFGKTFYHFLFCMIVITTGELIFAPTSSAYIANAAPAEMRGRYMSLFNLSQRAARGIGPVTGSWLGDTFGPRATWYGGFAAGLLSALGLFFASLRQKRPPKNLI